MISFPPSTDSIRHMSLGQPPALSASAQSPVAVPLCTLNSTADQPLDPALRSETNALTRVVRA
jgi:hypothetical protein